jgi:two-component system sensor histidine kinase SenX3
LVRNLLSLARIESGSVELDPRTISLNEALQSTWDHFQDRAAGRGLSVAWQLAQDSDLTTDPTLLDAALRNILDNAVSYADEGGSVTISTLRDADTMTLRVGNSGCAVTQSQAEELCDRFRRGDPARSATGTHCGLGLFLVRQITKILGGSLRIQAEPGGQYEIALALPAERSGRGGQLPH